jgi:hypothetical protein
MAVASDGLSVLGPVDGSRLLRFYFRTGAMQ